MKKLAKHDPKLYKQFKKALARSHKKYGRVYKRLAQDNSKREAKLMTAYGRVVKRHGKTFKKLARPKQCEWDHQIKRDVRVGKFARSAKEAFNGKRDRLVFKNVRIKV
jgi:hypothetical protein